MGESVERLVKLHRLRQVGVHREIPCINIFW